MSETNAYPLAWPIGWPRTKGPQESRFGRWNARPSIAAGCEAILEELKRLRAMAIVISTNVELRLDGLPYSNRREPQDAGVAVYFRLKGEPRVLACDKWKTVGENLWAIAKTIEATRGIERWGSVTAERAFTGYVALQEKTEASCWEVLRMNPPASAATGEEKRAIQSIIIERYRDRARVEHPDAGGTAEGFAALTRAKDMALQLAGA